MHPNPVLTDYRLDVGDLVQLSFRTITGSFPAQGEVHGVTVTDTVVYRVRIINASNAAVTAGVPGVGQFVDLPHTEVTQIGLDNTLLDEISALGVEPAEDETSADLLGRKWAVLFGDPRITKYLSAHDRLALSTVSAAAGERNRSVQGHTAVTPEVFKAIKENRDRLEPPLRPEFGERGQVTWMTIAGDPVIGNSAQLKDVNLVVQVFPGIRWADIPVIDSAELDRRVALALRQRLAALPAVVEEFLRVCPTWTDGSRRRISDENAALIADKARAFATTNAGALATFDPAARIDVLQSGSDQLMALLKKAVSGMTGNKLFITFVESRRSIHAAMWTDLGAYVATLPKQVARVVFLNSPLSGGKNGEYLIVASRRFLYVLSADSEVF